MMIQRWFSLLSLTSNHIINILAMKNRYSISYDGNTTLTTVSCGRILHLVRVHVIFVTTWLKIATYANESLQSINKKDIIPIVLSLQNKLDQANSKVLEEIRELNDNFSKLESKLSKTKQVNSLLSRRLVNIER